MNKKIIETNVVCEVYRVMNKTRKIDTYIDFNDKKPIWDGDFHLYEKALEDFQKKYLIDTIPTQVKGKCVKQFSGEKTKFQFNIIDLKKYHTDGGIFFIKGEVLEKKGDELDEIKLYYKSLLPIDIKKILDSKKRKSVSLEMERLPVKSEEIIQLFEIFLKNRKLQGQSVTNIQKTIEEVKNIVTVPKSLNARMNIGDEYYVYAAETEIPIPIDIITIDGVKAIDFIDIEMCGKKERIKAEITKNSQKQLKIKIFKYITITLQDKKSILNFNLIPTDAKNMIKSIELLRNITLGNIILINGKRLHCKESACKEIIDMKKYNRDYKYLKAIVEIAEYFGSEEVIDCTKVSIEYLEMAVKIRNALFNEEYKAKNNLKDKEILNIIEYPIGSSKILILGYFYNNILKVYDVFKQEFGEILKVCIDNQAKDQISYYLTLNEKQIQAINFNESNVLKSIKKTLLTEDSMEQINFFILRLIKAYDETERKVFLEIAKNLLEYIEVDYFDKDTVFINKMQINKRLGLNIDDGRLLKCKENSSDDMIKLAINILMDNKREAKYQYSQLKESDKRIFMEFPIYTLMIEEKDS